MTYKDNRYQVTKTYASGSHQPISELHDTTNGARITHVLGWQDDDAAHLYDIAAAMSHQDREIKAMQAQIDRILEAVPMAGVARSGKVTMPGVFLGLTAHPWDMAVNPDLDELDDLHQTQDDASSRGQ